MWVDNQQHNNGGVFPPQQGVRSADLLGVRKLLLREAVEVHAALKKAFLSLADVPDKEARGFKRGTPGRAALKTRKINFLKSWSACSLNCGASPGPASVHIFEWIYVHKPASPGRFPRKSVIAKMRAGVALSFWDAWPA